VGNAKWLIESINQRSNAVLRVVKIVLDRQRGWFDQGARALKPLPMTEVAELLGVHVATVSRSVSEKWMQTPRGIVPLRKFFSGGTETSSGENMSWAAVKAMLRDIVAAEDPAKPLGDEAIVSELRERGIEIARRTVVKYRQQMGIPPARLRKTY
jgi:RNA polymerase sigma-54 factor